jgi:hypothetical protein
MRILWEGGELGRASYATSSAVTRKLISRNCPRPWHAKNWAASDDRVRGGKSQSYLDYASWSYHETVRFHGSLDITALGGAGFASQRSPHPQHWDLSTFEGLNLAVKKGDGKKYTFIVKDKVLPKRPDGREQSSISWEYDFTGDESTIKILWKDLKPTYRGKPKLDAEPLELASIKRISIMMRRFVCPSNFCFLYIDG